jgi:hypothetical protein
MAEIWSLNEALHYGKAEKTSFLTSTTTFRLKLQLKFNNPPTVDA